MAEYQAYDYEQANQIIKSIIDTSIIERREPGYTEKTRDYIEIERGISIIDIQKDADEFSADAHLVDMMGQKFPAMVTTDRKKIPISLSIFLGAAIGTLGRYYDELIYHGLKARRGYAAVPGEVEFLDTDEARESFVGNATETLAYRIATARQKYSSSGTFSEADTSINLLTQLGGSRASIPGCSFCVTSNSSGLRVLWSGAYYITKNYFNHPTSPISSVLQSGTYVFGVDGGAYGNLTQWDNAVCSLPGCPSVHLNF